MREETRTQERAAMRLPASEVARFYTLYPAVLLYANQQLGLARQVTTIPQLMAMSEEEQYALRAAFYEHRELLEVFVHANPQGLSDADLGDFRERFYCDTVSVPSCSWGMGSLHSGGRSY